MAHVNAMTNVHHAAEGARFVPRCRQCGAFTSVPPSRSRRLRRCAQISELDFDAGRGKWEQQPVRHVLESQQFSKKSLDLIFKVAQGPLKFPRHFSPQICFGIQTSSGTNRYAKSRRPFGKAPSVPSALSCERRDGVREGQ